MNIVFILKHAFHIEIQNLNTVSLIHLWPAHSSSNTEHGDQRLVEFPKASRGLTSEEGCAQNSVWHAQCPGKLESKTDPKIQTMHNMCCGSTLALFHPFQLLQNLVQKNKHINIMFIHGFTYSFGFLSIIIIQIIFYEII